MRVPKESCGKAFTRDGARKKDKEGVDLGQGSGASEDQRGIGL
jgi:hypothetical protein